MTAILLGAIFFLIDMISKILVDKMLPYGEMIEVIKNFFYLTYTHNIGAAFSILMGKRIFLIVISVAIIIFILYYLKKSNVKNKIEILSFALILGGATGNLVDRIIRGYVIDFIDIKIFGYDYPVFNLADTFIVIGVIILFVLMLFRRNKANDS